MSGVNERDKPRRRPLTRDELREELFERSTILVDMAREEARVITLIGNRSDLDNEALARFMLERAKRILSEGAG